MNMRTVFIVLICLCVAWYAVTTLLIFENLRRRGQKVSFLWLRVLAPWYASRYREITKSETGKVGPLFYHWIVSINLALILVLLAFAVRYL